MSLNPKKMIFQPIRANFKFTVLIKQITVLYEKFAGIAILLISVHLLFSILLKLDRQPIISTPI